MDPAAGGLVAPAWRRYLSDLWRHVGRATRADYTVGVASPEERAVLSDGARVARPVAGSQAQDYLAWRRSGLSVALALLGVTTVVATVRFFVDAAATEESEAFDTGLVTLLDFLLYASKVVLLVACWLGLAAWHDLRTSHRRVRLGWWIGFAIPFLVALVPLRSLLRLPDAAGAEELAGQQIAQGLLGLVAAIVWFLKLMPAVLSILAGAIRSAVAVKQFAPESAVPGWIAVVSAPVLCLLALVVFVLLNQMGGSLLLVVGFGCLVAGILVPTLFARRLARPHARAELSTVLAPIRRRAQALTGTGVVLVLVAAFTIEILGTKLVAFSGGVLGVLDLLEMGLDLWGRALFTTVLFSDLIVALLRHSWNETQAFRLSELSGALEEKVRQLEAAGIGELRGAAPSAAPPAA